MAVLYPKRDLLEDRVLEDWQHVVVKDRKRVDKIPHRLHTVSKSIKMLRNMWSSCGAQIKMADSLHWEAIYPPVSNGQSEKMRDFTTLAATAGYIAEIRQDCTAVLCQGVPVEIIPHSDGHSSLMVNLSLYKYASLVLKSGDLSYMRKVFPHSNSGVLQYFTPEGKRLPGAEMLVPESIVAALDGEQYNHTTLEQELFLLHAACLTGDFRSLPYARVESAVEELRESRQARLKWKDRGAKSKMYMYPGVAYNNTYWKFKTEEEYDYVFHPGSGDIDRLSRRCFGNAKVVCVDPSSTVPSEQLTFDAYVKENPRLPPGRNLVCSDMAWANDVGLSAQPTNDMAAKAIMYALDNDSDFMVKVAFDNIENLPPIYKEKKFAFFKKPRLHNAEVIVVKGDQTMVEIFESLAYVIKRANELREEMTDLKQWPSQLFADLKILLPPLSDECLVVYEDDKKFDRSPPAGLVHPHTHAPLTRRPRFGELTVQSARKLKLHDICYDALTILHRTSQEVAAEILARCPYMELEEVYAHISVLANEFGWPDDAKLTNVVFN